VPGTYTGNVAIASPGNATINIPVTLTVAAAPQVTATPASVALSYQIGGTNNSAQQTVALSTNGSLPVAFGLVTPFTVTNNPAGRVWFTVIPLGGNIPAGGTANLTVAYDATANLPAGTYTGSFIIQTPGGVPTATTVPVTLTVSTSPLLSASPSTLNFTYQ